MSENNDDVRFIAAAEESVVHYCNNFGSAPDAYELRTFLKKIKAKRELISAITSAFVECVIRKRDLPNQKLSPEIKEMIAAALRKHGLSVPSSLSAKDTRLE